MEKLTPSRQEELEDWLPIGALAQTIVLGTAVVSP